MINLVAFIAYSLFVFRIQPLEDAMSLIIRLGDVSMFHIFLNTIVFSIEQAVLY